MIDTPRASRLVLLFTTILLAVLFTTVLLVVAPEALAQTPRIQFDVRQNGTLGNPTFVGGGLPGASGTVQLSKHHAVAADGVGNVYVVGQDLTGNKDMITIAYDRRGIERWRRTKAGAGNSDDKAQAVAVDSAGNVYVAGYVYTNATQGYDAILISYDTDGNERWGGPKLFNSCSTSCFGDDFADIVVNTSTNRIYAVGSSEVGVASASLFVVAYDSAGNALGSPVTKRAGNGELWGRAIALDADGNVYVTGDLRPVSPRDYYTTSFTSTLAERWTAQVDVGPLASSDNTPYAIAVGGDRVYVTGELVTGTGLGTEYYTVAYDRSGTFKWTAREAGTAGLGRAWSVAADAAGKAYVTGALSTADGGCYTVSYDPVGAGSTGVKLWGQASGASGQVCYAAALDQSSNLYVTGDATYESRPGMVVVSYTSGGTRRWRRVTRTADDGTHGLAIAVDSGGTCVYAAGSRFIGNPQFITANLATASGTEVWTARSRAATSFSPARGRHAVATDAAGNTYVVGRKWNGINFDLFTISYNPAGGKRWETPTDGPAGLNDWAYAVTVAPGGLVIVTGVTEASNHELDYMTVCYSAADGSAHWVAPAVKDGTGHDDDVALAVVADSSGHVFVTGPSFSGLTTYYDFLTVAYNTANGSELWSVTADGTTHGNDQAADIAVDASGWVWVTGSSETSSTTDILTIKYNPATGAESPRIVTTRSGYNVPTAILATASAVYITGTTGSGGASSCLTIKYSLSGAELWQDEVASESSGDAVGKALAFDSARNVLHVAGYGTNAAGNRDFLDIRYPGGAASGEATFIDDSGTSDTANGVAIDPNGMVFLTGVSESSIELRLMTVALQPTGNRLWTDIVGAGTGKDVRGFAVAALPGRGAVVAAALNDTYDCMRTIAYTFSTPTIIAGSPLTLTAGATLPAQELAAKVDDTDTAVSSLVVTAIDVPADLTVGPITVSSAYKTAKATVGATCSATLEPPKTIVMQVRNDGYVTATANVTVNVGANTPPVLGTYSNRSIRTGEPITVTVSPWPTDNGTVTLNAAASAGFTGTVSANSTNGSVTITNPGPGNGAVYTITVSATDNCGLATDKTFQLTVTGPPPPTVVATATSPSAVHLTWTPTAGALSYDIWRSSLHGSYSATNVPATPTAYDNGGLNAGTTYLYYVVARISGANTYRSNIDPATTILFTDDPVQGGTTAIKAVHLDELRSAVNAMRLAVGLAALDFTPASLSAVPIASRHITDLRSALNEALTSTSLMLPPLTPAYPATAGTPVRALDVLEMRNGVK